MTKHIPVADNSVQDEVPVRRQINKGGRTTAAVSITLPIELNQTINGIVVETNKSRSLVIAELLEKGLAENE